MMRSALVTVLFLVTATSAHADDACSQAYWSAKEVDDAKSCRISAEAGSVQAQFGYALLLWSGHGRTAQPREALDWFRKAARQGHLLSRVMLSRLLASEEIPSALRSNIEAYAWRVAAGQRDFEQDPKLALSPTEAVQGEQMAKELLSAYGPSR